MPLPLPILDDRSYQQLRDELIRRIPVYNPEWTDHNPSDPGITLIELFAFLGENLLYRFNQIPESTRLAFLQLLQIPLRPASPAAALVTFSNPRALAGDEPIRVDPARITAVAGALPFEIRTEEVTVAPWRALVVGRLESALPTTNEGLDYAAAAVDALGGLGAGETAAYYTNGLVPEDPSAPDARVVDFGPTVDRMIWIAVLGDAGHLAKLADKTLNIGFIPDEEVTSFQDALEPCPGAWSQGAGGSTASLGGTTDAQELVWEISTGRVNGDGNPIYKAINTSGDTTRGLRQQGVVRLRLPKDVTQIGVFLAVTDPDLQGTGDLPPVLDQESDRAETLFWLRAWHRNESQRFGRVLWMGLNAAELVQQKKAGPELVATGTGQAGQRYALVKRNLVAGSLLIEVEEQPGVWNGWTAVDSFEASREDDKHFTVDLEAGQVSFGNGVQGLAPQIGQRIRAAEYRFSQGIDGNVAAKAINKLEGPGVAALKVLNPMRARGGAAAESVAAGLERLPGELRRRDRAVTMGDFRELALATPGADVGRAECLPLFDPKTMSTKAAGVVTVVVWPREDAKHPDAPMPDRTSLRRVCQWLDQRRLITTELHVIPPAYVPISVAIGLRVKPGYGTDAVRSWVELVIKQYLAPLPPYGPEGQGWPLGRRVYGPELAAAALQVEGVEYLEDDGAAVALLVNGAWLEGPVALQPHEVPALTVVTVVAGPRLNPGVEQTPPPSGSKAIPIPIIPEEC